MHADMRSHEDSDTAAVPVEFPLLVATLVAAQSASPTAAAHTHHQVGRTIGGCPEQAIVTLLQARPGWRAAAAALGGSFHPGVAPMIADNPS